MYCAELGQYIVAAVNTDIADGGRQDDDAQAQLREAMLACVKKDDFNQA